MVGKKYIKTYTGVPYARIAEGASICEHNRIRSATCQGVEIAKTGAGPPALPSAASLLAVPSFRYVRLLLTRRATGTCFIDSKVFLHFTKTCLAPHRVPTAFRLPPLYRMLREPQVYAYARHTFACVRACVLLEIVAYTKYSL